MKDPFNTRCGSCQARTCRFMDREEVTGADEAGSEQAIYCESVTRWTDRQYNALGVPGEDM